LKGGAPFNLESPVTPYGFIEVTLTSLLDTPGCRIETLEPVSMIRLCIIPSVSTEIECLAQPRMKALTSRQHFRWCRGGRSCLPSQSVAVYRNFRLPPRTGLVGKGGFSPEDRERLKRSVWVLFPVGRELLSSLLYLVMLPSEVPYVFAFITTQGGLSLRVPSARVFRPAGTPRNLRQLTTCAHSDLVSQISSSLCGRPDWDSSLTELIPYRNCH
jgi:hypothetical protein